MKEIILGTNTYLLPQAAESPTWGEELSTLVEALADTVNNISGPYDVLNTLYLFNNNASGNVTGAALDPQAVNGAIVTYSARRTTSSVTATEVGQLTITYNNSNPSGSFFDVSQFKAGSAGLTFTMLDDGALNLTSSNLAGTGHVGRLRFSVRAFEA